MNKPKEQLFTCRYCAQPNFTKRGLRSHWCNRGAAGTKTQKLTKLEWRAMTDGADKETRDSLWAEFLRKPPALAIVVSNGEGAASLGDAEMGVQLTAQYHRAVNAMPEVLKFGAMMIMLRKHLATANAHDGHRALPRGAAAKDGGVKGWLEKHAPEVKRTTAQRFEDVTLGIAQDYPQLVGAKVAKQFSIEDLVTADPAKLPAPARKQQTKLFEFVSGTSQKSWLDQMRPAKERGGNTYERDGKKGKRQRLTAEEATQWLRSLCTTTAEGLAGIYKHQAWQPLIEAELDGLVNHCETILDSVKTWRSLKPEERKQVLAGQLAKLLKFLEE